MASWLTPSLIANLTSTIFLALAFAYLYRSYGEQHLRLWSLGWAVYAIRFVIELVQIQSGKTSALQVGHEIANLTSGVLLLWGARSLVGRRMPLIWPILGGLGVVWSAVAAILGLPFSFITLPSFTLVGAIYIWTGYTFLRHKGVGRSSSLLIGWTFILWGIHKFDYPILRPMVEVAPWGFLLSALFELVIAFGVFVLYFEKTIDERKQAELLARTGEERLREVVQNMPVLLEAMDENDRIIAWNKECERITGYSAEEIIGDPQPVEILFPDPALREQMLERISVLNNNFRDLDLELTAKNGDVKTIAWSNISDLVKIPGWHSWAVGVDVTASRDQERALRKSEQRFRAIFEEAGVGVNITEYGSGKFARVNRSLCLILGYTESELLQMTFKDVTHPDDLDADLELMEKLWAGDFQEFILEKRYIHKDGHVVWALLSVSSLWERGESPSYHIAVIQDITARKLAENELQTRAHQQAAVAQIGQLALRAADLRTVMQVAVNVIAETLNVKYSKILELIPGEDKMRILAGVGWEDSLIGSATVDANMETQAGFTLATGEAVVVNDLRTETRFAGSALLQEHDAISGVSVVINDVSAPFGVLAVHSNQPREFSGQDISFMQSVANVLSMTVQHKKADDQLSHRVAEQEALNRISALLRSASQLDELVHGLLAEMLALFNTGTGSITLFDARQERVARLVGRGWVRGPFPDEVNSQKGLLEAVRKAGGPLVMADIAAEPWVRDEVRSQFPSGWAGTAAPMRGAEGILGLLIIAVEHPRRLSVSEVQLLETISEMAGTAIQRRMLLEKTQRGLAQMAALHEIDLAISSSLDLNTTLSTILQHAIRQLGVDAAWISRLDENTQYLEYLSGVGTNFRRPELMRCQLGEGSAGTAALERRLVYASAPEFANEAEARKTHIRSEGFTSLCAAPLFSKGQVLGVLEVFKRGPLPLENEWSDYLEMLAGQASIAMDNLGLFDRMQRSHAELILAYNETIEGWSRAMDLRDHETDRHTQRVTEMSVRLATVMRIPDSEIIQIRRGALLHDIGKMGVPDDVLNKPGSLSPEEWDLMRRHPQLAYDMLAPVRYLRQALDIPYCHHEKWDGSGYPRGLKGEEIPLSARIFAIVDVWDALRSNRPYRSAWPEEKVRAYIHEQSGVSFDPRVVNVFEHLLDKLKAEDSIVI